MNKILLLLLTLSLASCTNQHDERLASLQTRIDSLEKNHSDTYKPGLGEFMIAIQLHHSKLWFAGRDSNWPLAGYELGELTETIDDIRKYETDRREVKTIGMIDPALDSLAAAVKQKDGAAFKKNYTLLTNTCNACHRTNNYPFNVIKVPDAVPVPDQVFTPAR